ncbi:dimeric dUTPase (all-alpha-NTP-PPase superfamily) [Planococcus citreus]|uniref:Dimeric dUTPase (All-alpha-NTP-PPase superfamily) n=1 Tax=Planococcus citreus TaxID=1373 RepID=A0A497YK84_9BACL|nr:dimeric dUTPase (all-alpha-NTP-PPase superfamily) [Planococcus citreus]
MIKGSVHVGISNLFEKQRQLDAEITEKHPAQPGEDRLKKKMLALGVELGECANEQRSWKFWSTDQEPRTEVRESIIGHEENGEVFGSYEIKNPLLEEFVDILHFVLSIGNEMNFTEYHLLGNYFQGQLTDGEPDVTDAFLIVNEQLALLSKTYRMQRKHHSALTVYYALLLESFLELGNVLGFTEEQIVEAYEQKNQINWERQAHGY